MDSKNKKNNWSLHFEPYRESIQLSQALSISHLIIIGLRHNYNQKDFDAQIYLENIAGEWRIRDSWGLNEGAPKNLEDVHKILEDWYYVMQIKELFSCDKKLDDWKEVTLEDLRIILSGTHTIIIADSNEISGFMCSRQGLSDWKTEFVRGKAFDQNITMELFLKTAAEDQKYKCKLATKGWDVECREPDFEKLWFVVYSKHFENFDEMANFVRENEGKGQENQSLFVIEKY